MKPERTVLFVCRFNSARSQLAEALARSIAPPGVRVMSAGLEATIVNEEVLRLIAEVGLDGSALRSKDLKAVAGSTIDDVVALIEGARPVITEIFPAARYHEWPFPDPIRAGGAAEVREAIRRLRSELSSRIRDWFREEDPCRP